MVALLDRQRTDDETSHQQGDEHRFLSHPTTEEGAIYSRGRDHCQSLIGVHSKQARLLQRILANLSVSTVAPLQHVQIAVARLIKGLRPTDHVTFSSLRPTLAANQASCHI